MKFVNNFVRMIVPTFTVPFNRFLCLVIGEFLKVDLISTNIHTLRFQKEQSTSTLSAIFVAGTELKLMSHS